MILFFTGCRHKNSRSFPGVHLDLECHATPRYLQIWWFKTLCSFQWICLKLVYPNLMHFIMFPGKKWWDPSCRLDGHRGWEVGRSPPSGAEDSGPLWCLRGLTTWARTGLWKSCRNIARCRGPVLHENSMIIFHHGFKGSTMKTRENVIM